MRWQYAAVVVAAVVVAAVVVAAVVVVAVVAAAAAAAVVVAVVAVAVAAVAVAKVEAKDDDGVDALVCGLSLQVTPAALKLVVIHKIGGLHCSS
jgi:hypothetical protein